jgi:hypothetical protein
MTGNNAYLYMMVLSMIRSKAKPKPDSSPTGPALSKAITMNHVFFA